MKFGVKRCLSMVALILFVVPTFAMMSDAYAIPKHLRPVITCFAAIGIDPHGMLHAAYFYRVWMAKKQAAIWISAGCTRVALGPC